MKNSSFSRRRFLSVCAMSGLCAGLPWFDALASVPLHRWNGILLGAEVHLTLAHPDAAQAKNIFKMCVREIKRLENIFTLYDSRSDLSRLNADGFLDSPAPEMVDLFRQAQMLNALTQGHFDVTVKSLEEGHLKTVPGMDTILLNAQQIKFLKPETCVTFNGIGQGYITDKITDLLKDQGLKNVLVELGETRALGRHPSGRSWMMGLQNGADPIPLGHDKALATSGALNPETGEPHIFNPLTGAYAHTYKTASVVTSTATIADGLSTAFLSMSEAQIVDLLKRQPETDAYINGNLMRI